MARFRAFPAEKNPTTLVYTISECSNSEETLRIFREVMSDEQSRLPKIHWEKVEVNDRLQTLRVTSLDGHTILAMDGVGLGYGSAGLNTATILYELAGSGSYTTYLSHVQEARPHQTVTFKLPL